MASSSPASAAPDRRSSLTQDLLDRRFPQYLAVYLGASWGLVEFFAFMEDRFLLSPHWTNLVMAALALLLPSVALFIYFHGRKGADRWHRLEKVGIPANVALMLVVLFGAFSGKDLGAVTTTVTVEDEDGNPVERVVAKDEFRRSVALFTPLSDSTREETAWLGPAVWAGLSNDLAQDMFLNVRPWPEFREPLRERGHRSDQSAPRSLKRLLMSERNIPRFVDGAVERVEEGFQLTLSLHDTERGRVITERVHAGESLFAVIDSASVQLRRDLGLPARHLEQTQDLPVTDHTTASMDAFRHYGGAVRRLLVDDDYPAATAALADALRADPTFADAAFSLYQVNVLQGNIMGAQVSLKTAMDNLHRLPERAHYAVKGEWYSLQQDLPRAFAVYEMWAELYPEDAMALQYAAQVRRMQNDREGVIRAYESLLELDPTRWELMPQIGALHEELGRPAEARSWYERHLELAPEDDASLRALAGLYRRIGEHDEARALYDRATLVVPGDVTLATSIASLDRDQGRFEEARAGLERALATATTGEQRFQVHLALALHSAWRGQDRAALAHRDSALAAGATFLPPVGLLQNRVLTLSYFVRAGRAEEALTRLAELDRQLQPPQDALVPFGEISVYSAMDDADGLEGAVAEAEAKVAETGLRILEDRIPYGQGRVHELRGEWREAVAAYELERERDPTGYTIPMRLGRCWLELGELERAESLIQETLATRPSHGESRYQLARVYQAMGRTADALAELDRALDTWAPADAGHEPSQRARALREELMGASAP